MSFQLSTSALTVISDLEKTSLIVLFELTVVLFVPPSPSWNDAGVCCDLSISNLFSRTLVRVQRRTPRMALLKLGLKIT